MSNVAQYTHAAQVMMEMARADARREMSEEMDALRRRVKTLENERDYARLELNRASVSQEELQHLRARLTSILAICRVPNRKLGAFSKLAMIVSPEQVAYSAERHGGDKDTMLWSMAKWNEAIGGGDEEKNPKNTNCIARALEPLQETGTITRELVDLHDGRKHFTVKFNEDHFRNPLLINPVEDRKHNGGDKRCPQCGQFCKKKFAISYSCEPCGLDFDMNMKPLGTPAPLPTTVVAQHQAIALLDELAAMQCTVEIDEHNKLLLLVPDAWTEEQYHKQALRVQSLAQELRRLIPAPVATVSPEKAPPDAAANFNDYSLDKFAGGCARHNQHRAKWEQYKSGLHCPECEPAYRRAVAQ